MKAAKTRNDWQQVINNIISAINAYDYSRENGSTEKCQEMNGLLMCIDKNLLYDCLANLKQVSGFIQTIDDGNNQTTIKGHIIKIDGNTVTVTPGLTLFRGVHNKEDSWTELSAREARARYQGLIRQINAKTDQA